MSSISLLTATSQRAEDPGFDLTPEELAREAARIGTQVKERLWQRMVRECEAMARYAPSTGRVIPAEVMECLDWAVSEPDQAGAVANPDRLADPVPSGTKPRPAADACQFVLLEAAHAGLVQAISPATPKAVRLVAEGGEKHSRWCEFGPLPPVRQMLSLALFSLDVLLGVSASAVISSVNMSRSLLERTGYPLLMVETFLVSAAALPIYSGSMSLFPMAPSTREHKAPIGFAGSWVSFQELCCRS